MFQTVVEEKPRAVVAYALQVVAAGEHWLESCVALNQQEGRSEPSLRLGAVASVAGTLLPRALRKLNARVELVVANTPSLLDMVKRGDLDAALVATTGDPRGLRAQRILHYRLRVWGLKRAFPSLNRVTSNEALAGYPLLQHVDDAFAAKQLVLAGVAVAELVDYVFTPLERKRLSAASIPMNSTCGVYLVSRADGHDSPAKDLVHALRVRSQ